jgi:hypothetical protein
MAKQNSVNLDITNNTDGFDVSGGATSRKLTVTGADLTLTGSGNFTVKFPTVNTTLAGVSIFFSPLGNQPPATSYATADTRNSIAVLDFDASTDESARFVGVLPPGIILSSGLKVRIFWTATSATSGTCRWGASIERMNTDIDSDSFGGAGTAGTTTNGTSGIVNITEITLTDIESITEGELFRLRVFRDADGESGTDDMTGDAELLLVEVRSAA